MAKASNVSSIMTMTVPAGHLLTSMLFVNKTQNDLPYSIKVGTENGGNDIVASVPLAAGEIRNVPVTPTIFSVDTDKTIHIDANGSWGDVVIDIYTVTQVLDG